MSHQEKPFSYEIVQGEQILPSRFDNHTIRRLSDLQGQFLDQQSYQEKILQEDIIVYEVFEVKPPEESGELMMGISVIHPGKVGKEYFMTKGHFHKVLETAEVYYTLRGEGLMVMESPEGEWAVETLHPGNVLYVPPRWAHRSVNIGASDLVLFYVYPGNAGHDYGSIERQGFRKLVIEHENQVAVVENPRWVSPQER